MKRWFCGSLLALAGLIGSADVASAGGIGLYIGFGRPAYPAYAAPPVVYSAPRAAYYSAPQIVYQPAPIAYGAAPVAYPAMPAYYQPAYPFGAERHRVRVRYRPRHDGFVYTYRERVRW